LSGSPEVIVHMFSRSIFLGNENRGFTKTRRIITQMMLDTSVNEVGRCGGLKHLLSRSFLSLFEQGSHKSFRNNSDSSDTDYSSQFLIRINKLFLILACY